QRAHHSREEPEGGGAPAVKGERKGCQSAGTSRRGAVSRNSKESRSTDLGDRTGGVRERPDWTGLALDDRELAGCERGERCCPYTSRPSECFRVAALPSPSQNGHLGHASGRERGFQC